MAVSTGGLQANSVVFYRMYIYVERGFEIGDVGSPAELARFRQHYGGR